MRKITKESSEAFVNFKPYKKDNTEVAIKYGYSPLDEIARFYLHGNCIAEINRSKLPECRGLKSIEIDLCGYHTRITRERINGVLDALGYDFRIAQRNHEQVLIRKEITKSFIVHNLAKDIDPKSVGEPPKKFFDEQTLKLSDDSFDPDFAKRVFESRCFRNGTDLNAITDF